MTERIWTEDIPQPGMRATLDRAELAVTALPEMWQIAGDIAAFTAAHPCRELGLGGDLGPVDDLLIRLGRDSAFWRSRTKARPASGWQPDGWAALPIGDGWTAFTLSGPGADDHLRRFVALDLMDGSLSAVAALSDRSAVILRDGAGWQIWCSAAKAWSLWQALRHPPALQHPA